MRNLITTTSYYSKKNDMWLWIGTKATGAKAYNFMHGDDYDNFIKYYCVPDEALSYFVRSITGLSSTPIYDDDVIELVWIFINLREKLEREIASDIHGENYLNSK